MFRGLIISAAILLTSSTAFAQQSGRTRTASSSAERQEPEGNLTRLMLGVDFKQTVPTADGIPNRFDVGFMWRWRSRRPNPNDRLEFAYRFGSYSGDQSAPVLGERTKVGRLRSRPLMVGADYKMPRGKWVWAVGVTTGWSINTLDDADAGVRDRVFAATGTADVVTDIHNSFAWSPRVKGWYDVNRRVSFMVEASYNYSRPMLTIRGAGVDMSRRLNADAVLFKAGVVYGIW